jgi:hypothetical protein
VFAAPSSISVRDEPDRRRFIVTDRPTQSTGPASTPTTDTADAGVRLLFSGAGNRCDLELRLPASSQPTGSPLARILRSASYAIDFIEQAWLPTGNRENAPDPLLLEEAIDRKLRTLRTRIGGAVEHAAGENGRGEGTGTAEKRR